MTIKINRKWILTAYVYVIFMGVTLIIWGIISGTILLKHYWNETISKTKSYYAAETWIEEWLLAFKDEPDIDKFVPNEAIIYEAANKRHVEYTEQKVYKKELLIKELIPAWKSIQLPFRKKDLDSRITQFHIWILKHDTDNFPLDQQACDTPIFDSALEISAYQKAIILATEPLDYTVELNSNWNGCYIGNNTVWKTSLISYTDPYSNEKISLIWDKCIMNSQWNVTWAVFEVPIPYIYNDRWDADDSNNTCDLDCSSGWCSKFYTHNIDVVKGIQSYLKFYTIAANFIWNDMSDEWLILFNLRAINNDVHVIVWATDDVWNPYEIPWRYINFSSLWITQGWDLNEWLFTRLKLKKKFNADLLPIFDYALYSESEFIK